MKPDVDQILGLSAGQLMGALAPHLSNIYEIGSATTLGIILMLSAQEYERAAEIRAAENADMRELFRECAERIEDSALKTKLLKAADTRDASFRISALNAQNAELRRVLIALQVYCEDKRLSELERRIWTVLKASAERRLLKLA